MSQLDAIFKAYDIRGIVPDELNADIARKVAPPSPPLRAPPASSSATTCARPGRSWWRRSPKAPSRPGWTSSCWAHLHRRVVLCQRGARRPRCHRSKGPGRDGRPHRRILRRRTPGRQAVASRRPHRRLRGLVVQCAPLQYRASGTAERRSRRHLAARPTRPKCSR